MSLQIYKKILLPLDGTGFAETLLPHAITHCKSFQAQCHILRVIDPPTSFSPLAYAGFVPVHDPVSVYLRDMDQERKEFHAYLQQMQNRLETEGIRCTYALREGDVVHEILAEAEEQEVDLILIASHQRSGLGRLLVPNTSTLVSLGSDRPVLIVPGGAEASLASDQSVIDTICAKIDAKAEYVAKNTSLEVDLVKKASPKVVAMILGAVSEERVRKDNLSTLIETAGVNANKDKTALGVLQSASTPNLQLVSDIFGERASWAASELAQQTEGIDSHHSLVLMAHLAPVVLYELSSLAVKGSVLEDLLSRELREMDQSLAEARDTGAAVAAAI